MRGPVRIYRWWCTLGFALWGETGKNKNKEKEKKKISPRHQTVFNHVNRPQCTTTNNQSLGQPANNCHSCWASRDINSHFVQIDGTEKKKHNRMLDTAQSDSMCELLKSTSMLEQNGGEQRRRFPSSSGRRRRYFPQELLPTVCRWQGLPRHGN